jgi:hypothetical protein
MKSEMSRLHIWDIRLQKCCLHLCVINISICIMDWGIRDVFRLPDQQANSTISIVDLR